MASDAVPAEATGTPLIDAWWFRFVVRAVLAVLAFLMLRLSADQLRTLSLGHSVTLQMDRSLWLESIGSTVAAGLLFGLATWFPFTKVRLLPSRLLLAAAALLPVAHFWWSFIEGHGTPDGWLGANYWFDNFQSQYVFAALAGVAFASCLTAQRADPATTGPTSSTS
jgi:hypothetical protein